MWICYGWTVELCNSVEKRKRKQQCETQEIFHIHHRLGIRRERKKTMGQIEITDKELTAVYRSPTVLIYKKLYSQFMR